MTVSNYATAIAALQHRDVSVLGTGNQLLIAGKLVQHGLMHFIQNVSVCCRLSLDMHNLE